MFDDFSFWLSKTFPTITHPSCFFLEKPLLLSNHLTHEAFSHLSVSSGLFSGSFFTVNALLALMVPYVSDLA